MMYLGDFREDHTAIVVPFTTNDKNGGRIAPSTAFEAADFRIYKNGGATQKTTTNGLTLSSPFDSMVGVHFLIIDSSNDTGDAGFWAAGNDYQVVLYPDETVDGENVAGIPAVFSIENRGGPRVVPAGYLGDVAMDQTLHALVNFYDAGFGPANPSGGTLRAYRANSTTEITTGLTLTVPYDSLAGVGLLTMVLTDASYIPGDYSVILQGASLGGVTISPLLASFSIENRGLGDVIIGSVTNTPVDGTAFRDSALPSSDDDEYVNMVVYPIDGTGQGIPRKVTAFVGSTKELQFAEAFPFTFANGQRYKMLGRIE